MKFEGLANELVLDVFEYLSSVDLLRAFYKLNQRLNQLVSRHFQSFALDFRSTTHGDLYLICRDYLPHLADHIRALILSNNDDTPQQIDLFLGNASTLRQLHHLRSLSVYELCSAELVAEVMHEWQYLPNLTHLTLAGFYLNFSQFDAQRFIDSIWSLPNLISCYLNVNFGRSNRVMPRVKSLSLKYVFIWGIEHTQNEIDALLKQTSSLEHLSILFRNEEDGDPVEPILTGLTNLKLGLSSMDETRLVGFFQRMPNLSHLTVDMESAGIDNIGQICNGYQWEDLIRYSLPKLQSFRFRMEFQLLNLDNPDEQINDLFNSFRTPFWIEEHRWFIAYHYVSSQTMTSNYLYTLPYAFDDFHLDCSMQFKSTCPNEHLSRCYNHVNQLHYLGWADDKSVLPPLQFLKIKRLSVRTTMDENFRRVVPTFEHMTTLYLSTRDYENVQAPLKLLMNQIPKLDSLSITSFELWLSISETLRNVSVRRLDLRACGHYFNEEDIPSLFDIRCKTLLVKIATRNVLVGLISHMAHLRTLNVQCRDDQPRKTKEDECVIWLMDHLPSTCIITRDRAFRTDIQIWIR